VEAQRKKVRNEEEQKAEKSWYCSTFFSLLSAFCFSLRLCVFVVNKNIENMYIF
jgi:hypothetical protein